MMVFISVAGELEAVRAAVYISGIGRGARGMDGALENLHGLINKTDPHPRHNHALNNVSRPKMKVNKSESKN